MNSNLIFFIFILGLMTSCSSIEPDCNEDGSLDDIKVYMPENHYFKSGLKSLHFVLETHPIKEVDSIFWNLINAYNLPVSTINSSDGIYIGESPYDAYDYKHVVELTIKDKKIIDVKYNEIHKDGSDKESDKKYNELMSESGTSPAIAYPVMEKQLSEKQEIWKVDAVSGATYSLYRFRYAVTLALIKAELAADKK